MKIHRFIGNYTIAPGTQEITESEFVNQVRNVLKLRAGENIVLCDGRGVEAEGEIVLVSGRGVEVRLGDVRNNSAEPKGAVVLALAILKNENFEIACQKATEAGVARIVPVLTDRTVKKDIRRDRLGKIVREAAEQSGRGTVPALDAPTDLAGALGQSFEASAKFFFDMADTAFSSADLKTAGSGPIWLFIGPEGGWTPQERETAIAQGCKVRSLGSRVLRAETAVTVSVFNAVSWMEGF